MVNKRLLLVSSQYVKDNSLIERNTSDEVLKTVIFDTQIRYVKPILGATLYADLVDAIELAALPNTDPAYVPLSQDNTELWSYVKPYLTYQTLLEMIVANNYKVSNKGILKMNDNQATNISAAEMESFRDYIENNMTTYKSELVNYLKGEDKLENTADTDIVFAATGFYIPRELCKN